MKVSVFFNKAINRVIRHMDWYRNDYWKGVTKLWYNVPFNLDVVNLGSGAGVHAFNYDGISTKGMNWALSPQSLVYDFNLLRNYSSFLKTNATIIIPICPFSCLFTHRDKSFNLRYYTILHVATIPDFDDNERTKALQMQKNPFKYAPWLCFKRTAKEIIRILLGKTRKKCIDLETSANNFILGWKKEFGITDLAAPLSKEHKLQQESRRETLRQMIDFSKERGFKPVIVIPPMYHTLWQQFPEQFFSNYIEPLIEGINAPFFNYMKGPDFDKKEYFDNALFMSKKGANVFTRKLLSELGLIK